MRRAVLDLLVPLRCAGCDRPAPAPLCAGCAEALAGCALAPAPVELAAGVRAVGGYRHEGVARRVLLAAKLGGRRAVLPVLGGLLAARLPLPPPGPGIAWTSVPPTARTRRRRGVDVPAALAAHAAAGGDGAPQRLLRPAPAAAGQTGQTAAGRRAGARGRYAVRSRVPPAVVLVDDVRTTGATAAAGARALQDAGAQRVLVVTFSVAPDPAG